MCGLFLLEPRAKLLAQSEEIARNPTRLPSLFRREGKVVGMRDLVAKTPNVTQLGLEALAPVFKAREALNDKLLVEEIGGVKAMDEVVLLLRFLDGFLDFALSGGREVREPLFVLWKASLYRLDQSHFEAGE